MRWVLLLLFVSHAALADTPLPRTATNGDYRPVNAAQARIGQLLFYDRILSGNRNIACSSCHHPSDATGDGLSLGLGAGAVGFGHDRHVGPDGLPIQRVPRNTPSLFNLGAVEFVTLFDDGRVQQDASRRFGIRTPLPDIAAKDLASVLAAQTMFPILSPVEMAGQSGENEVADAVAAGIITGQDGALDLIARRVSGIAAYRNMFAALDPGIREGRAIRYSDIANALAAFVQSEWRADRAPFDAYLRGGTALSPVATSGMALFYGGAGCSRCHGGTFQTDHDFHAMGQPQLGPGRAAPGAFQGRDTGRMLVTNSGSDAFAFRTPSLRNVTVTGPWGHAGAFGDLRDFLRQHTHPAIGMEGYVDQAVLPPLSTDHDDWAVSASATERALIANAAESTAVDLSRDEIDRIVAFLDSLTDDASLHGRLGVPADVPSGLAVDGR